MTDLQRIFLQRESIKTIGNSIDSSCAARMIRISSGTTLTALIAADERMYVTMELNRDGVKILVRVD